MPHAPSQRAPQRAPLAFAPLAAAGVAPADRLTRTRRVRNAAAASRRP
jgi:hypothetical protein